LTSTGANSGFSGTRRMRPFSRRSLFNVTEPSSRRATTISPELAVFVLSSNTRSPSSM
jgi:hypothetical protein